MKGVSAKHLSCGHERALRNSHLQKDKEERQKNPPVHTECIHTGGAVAVTIIVNGANAVSSFIVCTQVSWNMDAARRRDNGVQILADVNVTLRLEKSVEDSAGPFTITPRKDFRETEAFGPS